METVLWQSLPVIVSIAVPALLVLVGWLAKKLGKNLDVAGQAALNELVTNLTVQGVAYAEQMAKKRAAENEVVNGQTKLYVATEYILDQLAKHNIPQLTATEIQKRVESVLGLETIATDSALSMLQKGGENEDDFDIGS